MNRQDAKHAKNAKEVAVECERSRFSTGRRSLKQLGMLGVLGGSIFRVGNTQ
ncbi:MAG TPA: hypothetical protein VJM12_13650 [Pyrinomonadaceae bacterium]|nr:hypothetical protein [Pyrinomonadaceae bacterium]